MSDIYIFATMNEISRYSNLFGESLRSISGDIDFLAEVEFQNLKIVSWDDTYSVDLIIWLASGKKNIAKRIRQDIKEKGRPWIKYLDPVTSEMPSKVTGPDILSVDLIYLTGVRKKKRRKKFGRHWRKMSAVNKISMHRSLRKCLPR